MPKRRIRETVEEFYVNGEAEEIFPLLTHMAQAFLTYQQQQSGRLQPPQRGNRLMRYQPEEREMYG